MKSFLSRVQSTLLVGPTGSGKTPFGDYLQEHGISGRTCFHFDFGHELRSIVKAEAVPPGFTPKEYSFIQAVLKEGLLLEDEHFYLAEKILLNFLYRNKFRRDSLLILNGLPRHIAQAEALNNITKVESLLVLDCKSEDAFLRINKNTGKDRAGRSDDSLEMIRKKLKIFNERTSPLIDFYSVSGSNIFRIKVSASSTAEQLYSGLFRP